MEHSRLQTVSRIFWALLYGGACHLAFGLGAAAMVWGLYTGLTQTFGRVPWPWAGFTNALLLIQFPLCHSLLLSKSGRSFLERMAPELHGQTLATTTYAFIASVQLLALFTLWTPTNIVLWQASGAIYWVMGALFASSWGLLAKASFDSGPELQSGSLGWMSLLRGRRPLYPDMPQTGLFRIVRQPIYLAFSLTLWTMPTWTVDQLVVAVPLTLYCLYAPRLKERRFSAIYGDRFNQYQQRTPYMFPWPRKKKSP